MQKNCKIWKGTIIRPLVNLYGCVIGTNCMIGTFVEIQRNVKLGNRFRCLITKMSTGGYRKTFCRGAEHLPGKRRQGKV